MILQSYIILKMISELFYRSIFENSLKNDTVMLSPHPFSTPVIKHPLRGETKQCIIIFFL